MVTSYLLQGSISTLVVQNLVEFSIIFTASETKSCFTFYKTNIKFP